MILAADSVPQDRLLFITSRTLHKAAFGDKFYLFLCFECPGDVDFCPELLLYQPLCLPLLPLVCTKHELMLKRKRTAIVAAIILELVIVTFNYL